MRKLLATSLTAFARCLSFVPAAGAAKLQVALETELFDPASNVEQTVFFEVYVRDLDNTNEQLNTFVLEIEAPQFSPEGVRIRPPVNRRFPEPTIHPYVFQGFPGVEPEDFNSTYNVIRVAASLLNNEDEVDVANARNGLVRIPVIIPANAVPTFYPIVVDQDDPTAFAGRAVADHVRHDARRH